MASHASDITFLHLRKALEEIAFASLSANREKYSAERRGSVLQGQANKWRI